MPQQLEFFTIPSPCRGICQSDSRGYCLGCLRSREERFRWTSMADDEKRNVLRLCRQRNALKNRRAPEKDDNPQNQPSLF
ncbi:DUF1289 domain-containing protein [Leminorella richardii]|uniref:DUF1289 domain-containing protein n=1 Tax=Leminorella richardii TaxID=158841 RepID=UPI000DBEA554|nr:DUF1289 domain-containing protein [Leminorella richardii]